MGSVIYAKVDRRNYQGTCCQKEQCQLHHGKTGLADVDRNAWSEVAECSESLCLMEPRSSKNCTTGHDCRDSFWVRRSVKDLAPLVMM